MEHLDIVLLEQFGSSGLVAVAGLVDSFVLEPADSFVWEPKIELHGYIAILPFRDET